MRRLLLVCALVLHAAGPLAAQEPASPEALAGAYMDALRASDWGRVTSLMHPDALRDFKEMFTPLMAGGDAELAAFMGVSDAAEFAASPPDSIFGSFLRAVGAATGLAELLASAQIKVIGGLQEEGTDVTHVLYRMTMTVGDVTSTQLDVMPVRPDGDRWRALLSGDLQGMAALMQQQMERASGSR